jgi:cytoskeleton protein RodZ
MNKEVLAAESAKPVDELCEDMEVVGPGLMLSDARKKLSLSIDEVSARLNFRRNLVEEMEKDIFDQSLPATFNRGYLRSYAKLVSVDISEVMSAYDMLGVAEVQRSEMQSFSNLTEKQAEHSRLMWFSYLIAAILFGLMVVWWIQEPKLSVSLFDDAKQESEQVLETSNEVSETVDLSKATKNVVTPELAKLAVITPDKITQQADGEQKNIELVVEEQSAAKRNVDTIIESQVTAAAEIETQVNAETTLVPDISTVVFTFSGDCWVNIFDATGERVAWGVKKSGYVMTVTGKAPLKVTLGKPELATIAFNGNPVDMSSFNAGNIAKFTLPLITQ